MIPKKLCESCFANENKSEAETRRSNESKRGRCWLFFSHWSREHAVVSLAPGRSQAERSAASVCDRCKEGKQSGFMMLFYSSHSSPLVACFWHPMHTHSPALFAHETSFLQISTNTVGRARTKSVGNEI